MGKELFREMVALRTGHRGLFAVEAVPASDAQVRQLEAGGDVHQMRGRRAQQMDGTEGEQQNPHNRTL